MTSKRMRFLKELFAFLGLGGRLRLEWISSAEAQKFVQVVEEFTEAIRELGPNPLAAYRLDPDHPEKKCTAWMAGLTGLSGGDVLPATGSQRAARG